MAYKVFIWISKLPNDYGTCYAYSLNQKSVSLMIFHWNSYCMEIRFLLSLWNFALLCNHSICWQVYRWKCCTYVQNFQRCTCQQYIWGKRNLNYERKAVIKMGSFRYPYKVTSCSLNITVVTLMMIYFAGANAYCIRVLFCRPVMVHWNIKMTMLPT